MVDVFQYCFWWECNKPILADITKRWRDKLEDLNIEFKDDIIYIDTNIVFFRYNKNLRKRLEDVYYPKEITEIDNVIFTQRKKYIIFDNNKNITKIKGYHKI